jgi:cytochrome c oxidase subunit III
MSAPATIDVSHLPTTTFGSRAIEWWGTLAFLVIEGLTLFICAVAYLYLARNESTWPPEHTLRPDLFWPTVHVVLLAGSNAFAIRADRSARRLDLSRLRRWLLVLIGVALLSLALRWNDLVALNVRWDTNAYGSVVWFTAGLHGTLIAAEFIELVVMVALLSSARRTDKHFSDASDVAFYWYWLTGCWVPLYFLLYVAPRVF